jgi:hypothetical protein
MIFNSTVLWLVFLVFLVSSYSQALSQEMEVIRVLDGKIVGNKGSDDDVSEDQEYTIYRVMSTGPRHIGSAQVSSVRNSICVLYVMHTEPDFEVNNGDILMVSEGFQTGRSESEITSKTQSVIRKTSPYKGRIGIRGGIGIDTEGGLAGGGSLSYMVPTYPNPFEIGFLVMSGSLEEKTYDTHTYIERTDILATSLFIKYLFNYSYAPQGLYFIVGTGIAFIDVMWEKSSDTDNNLGKPMPGGGSTRADEGSCFGIQFEIGRGYKSAG